MAETNINAFYVELDEAKQEVIRAQSRVTQLEADIRARDGVVPGEEEDEAIESAPVEKSLHKMTKAELLEVVKAEGVENVNEDNTNKELAEAIEARRESVTE